jgi:hypothetical protein
MPIGHNATDHGGNGEHKVEDAEEVIHLLAPDEITTRCPIYS